MSQAIVKELAMRIKRKWYSPEFKAMVALEALRSDKPIAVAGIAKRYGIHPTMVNNWKHALIDGAADIFDRNQKSRKQTECQIDELYRQIGQLKVEERDFLERMFSF